MSDDEVSVVAFKEEEPAPRRRPKKLFIPKRAPSIITLARPIIYITPDKTTCVECTCFPKEDPYVKPKKLNPCLKSPLTLYELAAVVVDSLEFPQAFDWSEEEVADWMANVVGLPEYRECILDNHINGRRLLLLEDPSHMPRINISNWKHIQVITSKIHELFNTEYIKFARSIGLPTRKPLTHCTWFKSRTGPTWGIRRNWNRCDILRWMKIIMPKPIYLDHWDLVWYHKPDFPNAKFARICLADSQHIPHYEPQAEVCNEYLALRKFRLDTTIPESQQLIWMEHRSFSATEFVEKAEVKRNYTIPLKSRLDPKRVTLRGKAGKNLILARRQLPTPKFLSF